MMNVREFLDNNIDLSSYVDENFYNWMDVITTASYHTTRSQMTELFDIARPNEEDVFKKWRKDNRRHITLQPILDFKKMLTRVLQASLNITETEDFPDIYDYVFGVLMDLSIIDTNAKVIEWPFIPNNPDVSPSAPIEESGFGQNEKLDSKTWIVTSSKIKYFSNDLFIFDSGLELNIGTEKVPKILPIYYGCDKENYYTFIPTLKDKEVVYDLQLWYFHDMKRLPVASLPGFNTFKEDNGNIILNSYKESICMAAFEYLNEAVIAISSDQVTRIRHSQPKLVINAEIQCSKCSGLGTVKIRNENHICSTCNGKGKLENIGDFATINIKGQSAFDKSNSNPVYYVNGPSNIEYTMTVWEKLISKAEKTLCTDLLEKSGAESGIAKEYRLEPKQDLLKTYGEQFCFMVENLINNRLKIRNINAEEITINTPISYNTKSPEVMRLEMSESMPGERYGIYIAMINEKFRSDDFNKKIHKVAVLYAPLMLYKNDELSSAIEIGAYSEKDLKRRDYAIYLIEEILTTDFKLSNKEIFEKADNMLIEMGLISDPQEELTPDEVTSIEDLPEDLNELEEVLSKLLNEDIERDEALKLVMIIEGLDEQEAEDLLTNTGL